MAKRRYSDIGIIRAQAPLGARLPVELVDKLNKKAKEEGRIKKILIVRLLKIYIHMKYEDVLNEE